MNHTYTYSRDNRKIKFRMVSMQHFINEAPGVSMKYIHLAYCTLGMCISITEADTIRISMHSQRYDAMKMHMKQLASNANLGIFPSLLYTILQK